MHGRSVGNERGEIKVWHGHSWSECRDFDIIGIEIQHSMHLYCKRNYHQIAKIPIGEWPVKILFSAEHQLRELSLTQFRLGPNPFLKPILSIY